MRRVASGSTPTRSAVSVRAGSGEKACAPPWRNCRNGRSPASVSTRNEPVMEQARTTNRLVGSPIERIEDLRFLRGRGEYVGDLAVDGMLHAVVLRSSFAHGRIREADASAAPPPPGVPPALPPPP